MKDLQSKGFAIVEMTKNEVVEMNGGGWIADVVADAVAYVKCSCRENVPYSQSAIMGPNTRHYQ